MKVIQIKKGLQIPLQGKPVQDIYQGPSIRHIAVLGQDYIGLKPSVAVEKGEKVKKGQLLFTDKKNPGVKFTAPASGTVEIINRGAKRKFESLVLTLSNDDSITFPTLEGRKPEEVDPDFIRSIMIESGMWCCLRTRPYGKIPSITTQPASLFVTAIDTQPLAADPLVIINEYPGAFKLGLQLLARLIKKPVYLCLGKDAHKTFPDIDAANSYEFHGPHPAGLASTHIHHLDPIHPEKTAWHIGYQDVISLGKLFTDGQIFTERIISLAGPGVKEPCLLKTHIGADISELCENLIKAGDTRIISGSVLNGHVAKNSHGYLGQFNNQISVIYEGSGRGLFSWLSPGLNRFSILPLFLSSLIKQKSFAMNTAEWGGQRAIFPAGTYERVMPLDIIITALLKSLAIGDPEKSQSLGCLELIEEDLALCTFVCPGKNNFSPMLRDILTKIEAGE